MDLNHATETIAIVTGDTLTISSVGALSFPSGTTAQRPSTPVAGMQRFNTTLGCLEKYNGTTWNCNLGTDSSLNDLSDVVISPASGDLLQFNGTNWVSVPVPAIAPIAKVVYFFDDHLIADDTTANSEIQHGSSINWETFLTGTGSGARPTTLGINSTDRCIGVLEISTGTTSSGRCALTLGDDQILFGYAEFATEWRATMTTLSTAAQEYNVYVGFVDNSEAIGEPVDGAYFKYDRNTSANWIITTSNNSVRTNTTTSVAVTATTPFQKLRIVVNNTGTSAEFFIDGTSVGTITTNIPTGAGRFTSLGAKIEKTAGSTDRQFNMDYSTLEYTFTATR